jgi:K+-sensing histidine kinase KdpD
MKNRLPAWLWVIIAVVVVFILGWMDWLTGYELNFFLFYFIPILIGAWFVGLGSAVSLSVFSALVWFTADVLSGHVYSSHIYSAWNTVIRLSAFLSIGWAVSIIRNSLDREQKTSEVLSRALSEIKVLEAFLPICCQCKKIRNQEGVWQQLETYIGQHSNTQFSHGYCPECARKVMEEAGLI